MTSYSLIGIGHDCSPAAALRNMGLRHEAYPFDWVQTHSIGLRKCLLEDFLHFHSNLQLMDHGRRVIDHYGFQYPHDYPVKDMEEDERKEKAGEGVFAEEMGRPIVPNWLCYYEIVKEKYDRRIQRFRRILSESTPIILLSRYPDTDARDLLIWFRQFYKRNDIYIVNSASDGDHKVKNGCITVWTERDGIWNSVDVWKEGLDAMIGSWCD